MGREEKTSHSIVVTFHGVRGTRPVLDPGFRSFGGHTACVEVEVGDRRFILDAGSGLVRLNAEGEGTDSRTKRAVSDRPIVFFLSHLHHDHVMGFMFYEAVYREGRRLIVYLPEGMERAFRAYWESPYFPIHMSEVASHLEVRGLGRTRIIEGGKGVPDTGGEVAIETLPLDGRVHPRNGVMLYRIGNGKASITYATDIELRGSDVFERVAEFAAGSDLLICDAHFDDEEYRRFQGWGHNSLGRAVELAERAEVERLALFHHSPMRDDLGMKAFASKARHRFGASFAAEEGMRVEVG